MPNFFMREISVVRLIPIRAAAPVAATHTPPCAFQSADDLIVFIGFSRAR